MFLTFPLTHKGRDKMAAVIQTTFSHAFSEWKWINCIQISLVIVPNGPNNNIPALIKIMAWRRPGNKPLSEPMMVSLLTHIYASLGLNELASLPCSFNELPEFLKCSWWKGQTSYQEQGTGWIRNLTFYVFNEASSVLPFNRVYSERSRYWCLENLYNIFVWYKCFIVTLQSNYHDLIIKNIFHIIFFFLKNR